MLDSVDLRSGHRHEDVRAHILGVATELFAEHGADVSMRRLAQEIGYTATTIYLYFENKEELLFTVVQDAFERFTQVIRDARAEHELPEDQLVAMGRTYLEFAVEHPHHYKLMFIQRPEFLMDACPHKKARMRAFDMLVDTVKEGVGARSRTKKVQRIADAIWAAVHGLAMLHIKMPGEFDEDRVQQAMEVIRDMTCQQICSARS